MVSTENKQMAQFFAEMTERMSRTDLDLATIRDVYENLHLAAREPEGVCYTEVDIDGVPALWCVPTDCDVNRVLLHAHGGGTVIFSMHLDQKAGDTFESALARHARHRQVKNADNSVRCQTYRYSSTSLARFTERVGKTLWDMPSV